MSVQTVFCGHHCTDDFRDVFFNFFSVSWECKRQFQRLLLLQSSWTRTNSSFVYNLLLLLIVRTANVNCNTLAHRHGKALVT